MGKDLAKDGRLVFVRSFDSIELFAAGFERDEGGIGCFFPTDLNSQVGIGAEIQVEVHGIKKPFVLRGQVVWKRCRSANTDLPQGVYVRLTESESARFEGLIQYFRPNTVNEERRRFPRLPTALTAMYETSRGKHEAEVHNLSSQGAFLRCRGPLLPVGAPLPITLFIDGREKGLTLNAQVAWVELEAGKGMGIAFDEGQSGLRQVARAVKRLTNDLEEPS